MITSFFKPKSQKVKPVTTNNNHGPTDVVAASVGGTKRKANNDTKNIQLDDESSSPNKRSKSSPSSQEETNKELLSYLQESNSNNKNWKQEMNKHFSSPSFARLAKFVSQQRISKTVFPPAADTFSALNLTPLDKVKVVIVGQDPYHGPNQAHGLCFSVRKGVRIPPSLLNIYKELLRDKNVPNFTSMPTHGFLERWAKQGVLMINNVLTVQKAAANSHKNQGWEQVTDEIIRAVDRRHAHPCVFLLWGIPATKKATTALGGSSNKRKHVILCSSHPSPLGATKTSAPFMGSQCFSKANEALRNFGYDEIDWRVDGALS